jgi:hypothetical protein
MGELLDLRDGEGSAWTRAHVDECADCRAELERVHQRVAALRALPGYAPPRDRWPVVREGLRRSRRRRRWQRAGWSVLAAAAALVLLVGVRGIDGAGPAVLAAQEVDELKQESRQLEGMLQAVAAERRVMDGVTATVIIRLEDRIAVVDAGIADIQASDGRVTIELRDLWRERVQLIDQLVATHVQQASYVGY